MHQYYRLLILFSIISFASCKKFLDITPKSVASEKAFYKTKQDAVVAVNGAYNPLLALHQEVMWPLGEAMSDNTDDLNIAIDNFTYDAFDPTIERYWQLNYLGIARCNTVMEKIVGLGEGDPLIQRLLQEVHFLRGFYYFNLVRVFGGLPLVTKEVNSLNAAKPDRSSAAETWLLIENDLQEAEALPLSHENADKGRATKGAAKALLAKVYLTQKKWQQAASKAKEVMDLGTYQLLPDYANNFKPSQENNMESLFEVQYVIGGQTATGNFLGNNFFELFAPVGSGSLVTGVANSSPQGRNTPTADLVNAYESGDQRKDFSLRTSYTRPGTPPEIIQVNYITKHLDPSATAGSLGAGSGNNWRVLRYAEVLLIYAEALNELSAGNPLAYDAINRVRRRAGGTTPLPDLNGLDQSTFRMAVWKERRLELAFENDRWFDLLRTGQALTIMKATKNIQPRNLLFPIPQRERVLNEKLSQNEGY